MTTPHPLSWRPPAQPKTPPGALPHFRGPYTCEMAFTMPLRLGRAMPDALFAALLTRSPDADGGNYRELEGGWPRHPVRVVGRSSKYLAVDHSLLFDVPPQDIPSLGLFDHPEPGEGQLWFYGALRAIRTQPHPESRYEFPAYGVLLKKPPSAALAEHP